MSESKGRTPALSDRQAVAEAVRLLVGNGNVTELRALEATTAGDRRTMTLCGYFDDPDKLAEAVATIRTAKGIYIIPNAVNPALLARAANRIKPASKGDATQDTDITRRRWLLIDCDAQRPANISASDAEHESALERAREIFAHLQALGWPKPIAGDSGNGSHLLYRIDTPADDGGMVQRCLQALAKRFNDDAVNVDESVFNPARIWKLYGTVACKGDDTTDRPWRMARILHAPTELGTVPMALLQALASEAPQAPPAGSPKPTNGTFNGERFDLDDFLRRHGFDLTGPEDWNGKQGKGRLWTFRQSPMCEHHDGAAHLEHHASGAVTAGCHHNSCSWEWKDLRQKYEPRCEYHARTSDQGKPAAPTVPENKTEPAPTWVPFPVDVLPSPLSNFTQAAADALGCDPAYVALPLLSTMAAAVGNSRRVRIKRSWTEPCVLWTVTIGRSGTMKSPAWELATRPLQSLDSLGIRQHNVAIEKYQEAMSCWEADYAEWKRAGRKKGEPPPEKPIEPTPMRCMCCDATIEGLIDVLRTTPRGVLLARDELSGWLSSFDQYKASKGADVGHWLSMHRAGAVTQDRKTSRRIIQVPRAAVSIAGTVQPGVLAAALAGGAVDKQSVGVHFSNGLTARLLLAYPPPQPKRWRESDLSDDITRRIDKLVLELRDLQMTTDDTTGEQYPSDVVLQADAKREFIRFFESHAAEQMTLGDNLAAAWSKLEGYAVRFALLFHLVRVADGDPTAGDKVDLQDMQSGIALSRWFADEAARIYATIGGGLDNLKGRREREHARLVEWIRDHGGTVTVRDLTRGPRKYRDADAAETALQELAAAGLVVSEHDGHDGRRGRPARTFRLATGGDGNNEKPRENEIVSPSPVSTVVETESANPTPHDSDWVEVTI